MSHAVYGYHGEIHECFPAARRMTLCLAASAVKEECAPQRVEYLECWQRNKRRKAEHVLTKKSSQEVLSVPAYHIASDSVVSKDDFPSLRRTRPEPSNK